MDDNGKRILEMLSEGKISVEEAERLLSLVEKPAVPEPLEPGARRSGETAPASTFESWVWTVKSVSTFVYR